MAEPKTDIYEVVDDNGNVVGQVRYPEGGSLYKNALENRNSGIKNVVYSNASSKGGELVPGEEDWLPAVGSITYDKGTGRIKVVATKEVMDSDWFKNQYVNNDVFNQVAKMFKKDPDGNTTVMVKDKDGNVTEKKISDWIEEEAKALHEYSLSYMTKVVPVREQFKQLTNGGINMSDAQVVISQSSVNRQKYQYDDKTPVYLPSSIIALDPEKFRNMKSWDEDTQTISAKDFYEWYNFDNVYLEKGTRNIEKVLTWELNRLSNAKEYEGDDANQLARVVSFYKTLKNDKPSTNLFQDMGLFVYSFQRNFDKTLTDASVDLFSFIEDVEVKVADMTSLGTDTGKVLAVMTGGISVLKNVSASLSVGLGEGAKITATNLGEFIAGVDGSPAEQNAVEAFIAIGDITKGLMEGKGYDTVKLWAEQTGTPLNLDAISKIDEMYDKDLSNLAELSDAANTGRVLGGFAGEIVKQIVFTNLVGGAIGSTVKGAIVAKAGLTNARQAINFANDAKGLIQALNLGIEGYVAAANIEKTIAALVSTTETVEKIAEVAGGVTNLLAQGVSDTILNDEKVIHDMLTIGDNKSLEEAFNAVRKNTYYNIFGEVSGFGISWGGKMKKGATKWLVENTFPGATVDAATKRIVGLGSAKKHVILAQLGDWMAEGNSRAAKFFDKIFKASDSASRWYNNLHWREAQAAFNIARASKGLDMTTKEGIKAANEATQKAVLDRMALEISMNRVTRGIMREWQKLVNNPAIAKEHQEFQAAIAKLVRAEGADAVSLGKGTFMSQDSADYIALRSILDRLANKKTLTKAEEAYRKALQDRVDTYIVTHSKEIKTAADEVLEATRVYEKTYMDFAMKTGDDGGLGLYDREEVLGWRRTGFWGEKGDQYIPLVRIEGEEGTLGAAQRATEEWSSGGNYKAKLGVDSYSLKPGDVDAHYLDPSLAIYSQQVTAAKVIAARDWGDTLMKCDPLAKEIDTEGQAVTKSDIIKARTQIRTVVDKTFREFTVDDTVLGYQFSDLFKRGTTSTVRKTEAKMKKLLGLKTREDFSSAAYDLDAEDIATLSKRGYKIPTFDKMRNKYQLQEFYDSLSKADKRIVKRALGAEPLTVKNFNQALDGTDMRIKLQRNYVANNIANGKNAKTYNKYVTDMKIKSMDAETKLKYDKAYAEYADAVEQAGLRVKNKDDFTKMLSVFTEDAIARAAKVLEDNQFFNQLLERYAEEGVPKEVARRYLILQEFRNYFETGKGKKAYQEMINKNLSNLDVSGKSLTNAQKLAINNSIEEGMSLKINTEWAKSTRTLKNVGGDELLDSDSIFEYIYKQMSDFVDTTIKSPNVIQVLDQYGKFHLYEVDPTTASLYTTRPDLSFYKKKGASKWFNKTNRLARIGNVGWSLKSFMNQWARDPLNAFVMGGMVRTLGKNADGVAELLGPQVVELMKEAMGEAGWKDFSEQLSESIGREATEEEIAAAAGELAGKELKAMANEAVGDMGIETEYYRNVSTGYKAKEWQEFEEEVGVMGKMFNFVEEHSLGNFRETYLRKGVYAQAFNDAISSGKTVKEAKVIAEYTMLNATTNFSRAFAWGNNISTSVSFLGAAINGKASFWRLFEIDPIGVSSRFLNGLVIPMMALATQSMESEDDKAVYKSIPEYEKNNSIVFVLNGTKMKIPVPQELSAFLAPFRHAVEKANDANRHGWDELVWNDILGTSTIDLTGLASLDANKLYGDLTLWDRLNNEAQALISQLSPTIVKTAYMALSGIDPYTGEKTDTSKVYIDDDGNVQILDSKGTEFSIWLSSVLGKVGIDLSASSSHALLQALIGNGNMDILDMIGDIFSPNDAMSTASSLGERTIGRALSSFEVKGYNDPAEYAWREMVTEMQSEKEAILNSKEYQAITKQLAELDSTKSNYKETRTNLLRQYNELVQGYQQKVYNATKRIQSVYGSDYDRKRLAATISLMTFSRNFGDSLTQVEKDANKTLSYEARSRALQTMASMGFDSPTDLSIFGYMSTDKNGNTMMRMNSPIAIMNLPSEVWGTTDQDIANLDAIFSASNIKTKDKFGDEYQKAKKAGKQALKKYKSEWNANAIRAIAPYVYEHGVDNVLNNSRTVDELQRYLFIDNLYKAKESIKKLFGGK